MDPYHSFHRQFKAREERRPGLGWWALALAMGMLGLGQWVGHDNGEEGQSVRTVNEPKTAPRASATLSERAEREVRSARQNGSIKAIAPADDELGTDLPTHRNEATEGIDGSRLTAAYFRTALSGLAATGADLTQPLASHHRVSTRSLVAAQQMVLWGRQQGYHVEPMETPLPAPGQAQGELLYIVPLVKVSAPRPALIAADAQRIAAFAAAHGQLAYLGWEGIVQRR